jgi:hypothetical protein
MAKKRAGPGTTGKGDFFRIVVRPREQFVTFRVHDIGDRGHIERLSGQRDYGTWDTQAWLISKDDAHIEGNRLVPDTDDAESLFEMFKTRPRRIRADVFMAKES